VLGRAKLRARFRSEQGFTLIEALVAVLTGIVIVLVLFTILEVSVRQSAKLADRAEATQFARVAMNHIVDELHSACVSQGLAPVRKESGENKLILVNGYSSNAEISSTGTATAGARKDEIVYSPGAQTLTDYTYYATGVTNGEYTFAATASPSTGVRIGEHITAMQQGAETVPIFKYYAYATTPSKLGSGPSSDLNETTLAASGKTLEAAAAETVGAVAVSFEAGPFDNKGVNGVRAPQTSLVTLGFEVPSDQTSPKDEPCE